MCENGRPCHRYWEMNYIIPRVWQYPERHQKLADTKIQPCECVCICVSVCVCVKMVVLVIDIEKWIVAYQVFSNILNDLIADHCDITMVSNETWTSTRRNKGGQDISDTLLQTRFIQYRHLIPALVDRTSASAWLYRHPWMTCQKISWAYQLPM